MARPRVYRNCKLGQSELDAVIKVSEAAKIACVHPRTIRYHITRGNINAKKFGSLYAVSLTSLNAYYFPEKTY